MSEPQAYLNGRYVPWSQTSIPVWDMGFVLGATVAEVVRTFSGKPFRLEAHLERLAHSLAIMSIEPNVSLSELGRISQELASQNHRLLDPADDLNLTMFITPGPYPTMAQSAATSGPTVCIHTVPLPFGLWVNKYSQGDSLVTTDFEQVSPRSWPRELKVRSRVHYYLADRQARSIEPGARALMIDEDGHFTEATTANVVAYFPDEGLVGPPRTKVLPGISLAVLVELAKNAGIAYTERDLQPTELATAAEVLLTSTTVSVLPVTRFNGQPIGQGKPGPIVQMLLAAWSQLVGVDIVGQAKRFVSR